MGMRPLISVWFLPHCLSLNILLFLLGTNEFERHTFEFLAQQLALRDHQVTTVKPILIPEEPRLVKPKLHLVREKTLKNLLTKELSDELSKAGDVIPWKEEYDDDAYDEVYWKAHTASCYKGNKRKGFPVKIPTDKFHPLKKVDLMLNSNLIDVLRKEAIDVALVYDGNPCQLGITHVLGVPVIYFDLKGLSDETLVASNTPLSLDISPSKCFLPELIPDALDRLRNGICYLREYLVQSDIPLLSKLLSKKFRHLDGPITAMFSEDYYLQKKFNKFPSSAALLRSSSFFFVNTDPMLESPRTLSPRVIPVGGIHIDSPKPLFTPWNTSIESAKSGLIVVSLGTQANSAQMAESQVRAIFGALSKLSNYRIYWRIGPKVQLKGVDEKDVPSHINLTSYFPQNDLLAHRSCKLLVTNGGMSSLMEALAYGVPVVGIPLYGSNLNNLKKFVKKGLGLIVLKKELKESTLLRAMKSVLNEAKPGVTVLPIQMWHMYMAKAKQMSKDFRSRPATPFATALYYIELVGRHQGAGFYGGERVQNLPLMNIDLSLIALVLSLCALSIIARIVVILWTCMYRCAIQPLNILFLSKSKKND